MLLLFEHDIPVYLNSESSSPVSSDAFNETFYTPDSSQIDSTVEDTSECLIVRIYFYFGFHIFTNILS
jgi:hypothetical protein